MLYPPSEYYTRSTEDAEGNDIRGKAELIIAAKHRSGAVGTVDLRFVSKFARFENWEEGYQMMRETLDEVNTTRRLESRMNSESNEEKPGETLRHRRHIRTLFRQFILFTGCPT